MGGVRGRPHRVRSPTPHQPGEAWPLAHRPLEQGPRPAQGRGGSERASRGAAPLWAAFAFAALGGQSARPPRRLPEPAQHRPGTSPPAARYQASGDSPLRAILAGPDARSPRRCVSPTLFCESGAGASRQARPAPHPGVASSGGLAGATPPSPRLRRAQAAELVAPGPWATASRPRVRRTRRFGTADDPGAIAILRPHDVEKPAHRAGRRGSPRRSRSLRPGPAGRRRR